MKSLNKLINLLAVYLLICFSGSFAGCEAKKDDKTHEREYGVIIVDPKVTVIGESTLDLLILDSEVTVTFKAWAAATIKSISYALFEDDDESDAVTYIPVQVPAGEIYEMEVSIKFTVVEDLKKVSLRLVDNQGKTDEAFIAVRRIMKRFDLIFADNIDFVESINVGQYLNISGMVVAAEELQEFYYIPVVNGVTQAQVNIPIGVDKQNVNFSINFQAVSGLQKLEFTIIDAAGNQNTYSFNIKKISNILVTVDSWRVLYGESTSISGSIDTPDGVKGAKYSLVKEDGTSVEGGTLTVNPAAKTFSGSISVPEGTEAVSVRVFGIDVNDGEGYYEGTVRGRLKSLTSQTVYGGNRNEWFSCYIENNSGSNIINVQQLGCDNLTNTYIDWWDFGVYVRAGSGYRYMLFSPASWGQGGYTNVERVIENLPNNASCRTGGMAAVHLRRLGYTMISPTRPELADKFDQVETEWDLWDLQEQYKNIFDPVTCSITAVDSEPGTVHWIGWGPTNGSGKGHAGGPVQNAGLGLIRITATDPEGSILDPRWVRFDIKFPIYPNYKKKYKDNWIDVRYASPAATFPGGYSFDGWPQLGNPR